MSLIGVTKKDIQKDYMLQFFSMTLQLPRLLALLAGNEFILEKKVAVN